MGYKELPGYVSKVYHQSGEKLELRLETGPSLLVGSKLSLPCGPHDGRKISEGKVWRSHVWYELDLRQENKPVDKRAEIMGISVNEQLRTRRKYKGERERLRA